MGIDLAVQGVELRLLLPQLQILLLDICNIDFINQTVDCLGHPVELHRQLADFVSRLFVGNRLEVLGLHLLHMLENPHQPYVQRSRHDRNNNRGQHKVDASKPNDERTRLPNLFQNAFLVHDAFQCPSVQIVDSGVSSFEWNRVLGKRDLLIGNGIQRFRRIISELYPPLGVHQIHQSIECVSKYGLMNAFHVQVNFDELFDAACVVIV
ncbi:hypothetical protein D3C75_580880 [compost metagenome]